jgi:hypothetical protein
MKKNIALFVIIIIFIAIKPFLSGITEERSELIQLTQLFKENDTELEEWTLYTRGQVDKLENVEDYSAKLQSVTQILDRFNWDNLEVATNNTHWNVVGTYMHPTLPLEETVSVYTDSTKNSYPMYMSYEITVRPSNNDFDWEGIEQEWYENKNILFPIETQVFTKVQGIKHNLNGQELNKEANNLLEALSAQKIEQLKEATFVSVSAYNEKWANTLTSNGKKMNLQIGLRQGHNLGGTTTVTIGTPIITTEY